MLCNLSISQNRCFWLTGHYPSALTTYHWPTTQFRHVQMVNTPLDHHPHHIHPYIKHSYLPEWVNFFLDCPTMKMKALRCFEMLETLTPTTQHNNFSFIYLCAGIAQPVWWLGCRLDNRDLNPHGSQKFSSSPGAHSASYATGTTALSLGINWPVPETDHSPPSAKVMNEWWNTSTPLVCLHSVHRDITFIIYLFSDAICNSSSITSYKYWTGKVVERSTHGMYWGTSQYWHGPPVLGWDMILKPIKYKKEDYRCECCIWWCS
jgi:hypothetical protein